MLSGRFRISRSKFLIPRLKHSVIMRPRTTAAIIVIGDEILKGETVDTNSNFICKRLFDRGISVKRISVIGDLEEEIATEVKGFSEKFNFVFTCGGIGYTHDDRTFIGIAKAFNDDLILHPELRKVVEMFLARNSSAASVVDAENALKFATIPRSGELLWGRHKRTGQRSVVPIVRVRNVIVLPGVPQFCQRAFGELEDELFASDTSTPFYCEKLYLNVEELKIAAAVREIAARFEGRVDIGSYPVIKNSFYKTKLTVDSDDQIDGSAAMTELKSAVTDYIVSYDSLPYDNAVEKFQKYRQSLENDEQCAEFLKRLDLSVKVIRDILEEYPLSQMALSFNGGKDCTVLLHLLRIQLIEKYGNDVRMPTIHIKSEEIFPELTQFIAECNQRYNMELVELDGKSMKDALIQLHQDRPQLVAFLMGSRATDPTSGTAPYVEHRAWTDPSWPKLLRVYPILDWSYTDVWRFLRGLSVPYCRLYDRGFTSLGDPGRTRPNEALRLPGMGPNGRPLYAPAYQLSDERLERAGRVEILSKV